MDWYYSDGRQQFGPVNQAEFDAMLAAGRFNDQTLVWRSGMAEWAPLASVAQMVSAAGSTESGSAPASPASSIPAVRFCLQCGTGHAPEDLLEVGNGVVCASCKDVWLQRLREGVLPGGLSQERRNYAGFWIRVGAALTDMIVLWILETLITLTFSLGLSRSIIGRHPTAGPMFGFFSAFLIVDLGIAILYESAFVVYKGATPGKLALSLEVIREDGTRPGWGLAIGRYFAKLVSSFTMGIGFIMVGLDDEKRGLHDRICNTRVIRKELRGN